MAEDIEPFGTLLQTANFEPSDKGPIAYFDLVDSLDLALKRVEAVGGKVTFPKFRIENGSLATFIDSEGNLAIMPGISSASAFWCWLWGSG